MIVSTNFLTGLQAWCSTLTLPARLSLDRFRDGGPLAGLHAGLTGERCDLALAVATDMPFVNTALLRYMADLVPAFDAVVPLALRRNGPARSGNHSTPSISEPCLPP